jgi:hypothetical protein
MVAVLALFVQHPLRANLASHGLPTYVRGSLLPGLGLLGFLGAIGAALLTMNPGATTPTIPLAAILVTAAAGLWLGLTAEDRQLLREAWRRRREKRGG